MLLCRRTGCDQANGLLVLVCIYLYGVNSEPPVKGCVGRASTYIYRDPAFTSILTQLASRCSCFSPLFSGSDLWRLCSEEGSSELSSSRECGKEEAVGFSLTLNSTQSRSPLDEPSARSVPKSVGCCVPCRELQAKGSSRSTFCVTF